MRKKYSKDRCAKVSGKKKICIYKSELQQFTPAVLPLIFRTQKEKGELVKVESWAKKPN